MSDKILIVDDESAYLRLLTRIFRREYQIICAGSGDEAIEMLKLHNVALIISDQRMPGMTGVEFLKIAAKIRPNTIRIILTGYTDIDTLVEAINSGVIYKYISKPWHEEDLQQTVKRAMEHFKSVNALRESQDRFRAFIETTSELVWSWDLNFEFTYINPAVENVLGYKPEECLGKSIKPFMHEEDRLLFENKLPQLIAEKKGWTERVLRWRHKNGSFRYLESFAVPIFDDNEDIVGYRGSDRDITERKLAEDQLLYDAFHDNLTGLANRALFINHLQMAIERYKRNQQLFAVLFLDFDRFKVINDSLGHPEGDNLLQQVTPRLKSCLRTGDLIARLGGDEFAILLGELNTESDALRIAERIQDELRAPFKLGGRDIFISASIGITFSAEDDLQAEGMLRDADTAMYHAKGRGKAQYQVFNQKMHQQAISRLQMETDLHRALERREFVLHYQPIINLQTENLEGFEALVRWNRPDLGFVPPGEFIPVAEETGLILSLGRWILNESCRQLCEWKICNPLANPLTVSVNLSSKQFFQDDLVEQVAEALALANLEPDCLKLEITESYLLENTEKLIVKMNRLKELGVHLSLDDFGTGYSSLSYLHRLPLSYLKVDRSFVTNMEESRENSEIVNTIIKLAKNLKIKVVAEGIETAGQLEKLKLLNCEYGQGYYFSKPLNPIAANDFIDKAIRVSLPPPNLLSDSFRLVG
jgi:diguanylate cyclase (GGDEF)-like protein/PAS domain S-box-containing protein